MLKPLSLILWGIKVSLNLVDLAGSECQSKIQANGERLKEATKINLSLSALRKDDEEKGEML
jgi:hypothetical protein